MRTKTNICVNFVPLNPSSDDRLSCQPIPSVKRSLKCRQNWIKWIGSIMKPLTMKGPAMFPICIYIYAALQTGCLHSWRFSAATYLQNFFQSSALTTRSTCILLLAQWMNSRQQHILFSHLYLCEGLVVAADVEQAVIFRNQPTKTEK